MNCLIRCPQILPDTSPCTHCAPTYRKEENIEWLKWNTLLLELTRKPCRIVKYCEQIIIITYSTLISTVYRFYNYLVVISKKCFNNTIQITFMCYCTLHVRTSICTVSTIHTDIHVVIYMTHIVYITGYTAGPHCTKNG